MDEGEVLEGFTFQEFVASCSTCMGKEGLLNSNTTNVQQGNQGNEESQAE